MKDKMLIVGVGAHGCSQKADELISKLDSLFDFEVISPEKAAEMNVMPPHEKVYPIIAPPKFETYFTPPPTRAERRKQQRKSK